MIVNSFATGVIGSGLRCALCRFGASCFFCGLKVRSLSFLKWVRSPIRASLMVPGSPTQRAIASRHLLIPMVNWCMAGQRWLPRWKNCVVDRESNVGNNCEEEE